MPLHLLKSALKVTQALSDNCDITKVYLITVINKVKPTQASIPPFLPPPKNNNQQLPEH